MRQSQSGTLVVVVGRNTEIQFFSQGNIQIHIFDTNTCLCHYFISSPFTNDTIRLITGLMSEQ